MNFKQDFPATNDFTTCQSLARLAESEVPGTYTRVLARAVLSEYLLHGRSAAIGFLRGYYYGTGSREGQYPATRAVGRVLDLRVEDGDLS